jgi:2-methoxy-6-polyprenyl-1,4-benzoquinol methylase
MQHLDVAGGTGDVAFKVLKAIQTAEQLEQQDQHQQWPVQQQQQQQTSPQQVQPQQQEEQQKGHVTVFDINPDMLQVGRSKAAAQGKKHLAAEKWLWCFVPGYHASR